MLTSRVFADKNRYELRANVESVRAYVDRAEAALGRDIDWQRVDEQHRPSGEAP